MKGYLLDTNVALWAVQGSDQLSGAARAAIETGPVWASVICYWEVTIKASKGLLHVGDPRHWWSEVLNELGAQALLFNAEHVAAVGDLPPLHRDPFDRALVAQAIVEDLTLMSSDGELEGYGSKRFRLFKC